MQARCLVISGCLAAALLSGCHDLGLGAFFDKEEALNQNVRSALRGEDGHSRLIGDYIKVSNATRGYIKVQGVGLMDRLDGTGEDPPASPYRTMLLEDIRKHEFEEPQTLLRSANTAIVIVTAKIPPIVKKGDRVDVEIILPDGSESTSLAGGWLMPCYLSEHALLGGQVRDGKDIAIALGPILIDALGEKDPSPIAMKRGTIPGGAIYTGDDRQLSVAIRSDYRTVRMSTQIAQRIGRRFHDYDDHGIQRPLAEAKSHAHLELLVHERYRENYSRYLQVIRHIRLSESPVEKHLRLQQLTDQVSFGPTAARAALELEAIGTDGIPILKEGLKSPDLEARFYSGEALAYLGNSDGVDALYEAADTAPAFRIFALSALAVLDDGRAADALRRLMDHDSIETRYGAFRSLLAAAPYDPHIEGIEMEGNFVLHPVESTAEPLIHVTRQRQPQVVVFDTEQRFTAPMFVRAGRHLLIQASPLGDEVTVKRIAAGEKMQTRTVSTRVIDVIKAASRPRCDLPGYRPDDGAGGTPT